MKKIITVTGMSCNHCVNHVKEALGELDPNAKIDVSLADGKAVFESSPEISDKDIKKIIDDYGYAVSSIS